MWKDSEDLVWAVGTLKLILSRSHGASILSWLNFNKKVRLSDDAYPRESKDSAHPWLDDKNVGNVQL